MSPETVKALDFVADSYGPLLALLASLELTRSGRKDSTTQAVS